MCPAVCGTGTCEVGETCGSCPQDCGVCGGCGDNVCAAEVRQVVYLGASTQYIVELEGGAKLVLYQQNAYEAAGPSEGDGVSVTWDAQNCLVLGG